MTLTRRQILCQAAGSLLAPGVIGLAARRLPAAEPAGPLPIVDTHQHLWDLEKVNPPWLKGAAVLLRQRYTNVEYAEATAGSTWSRPCTWKSTWRRSNRWPKRNT